MVAPRADPQRITLGFSGAERLEITAQGALVVHTGGGRIRMHRPVVYQEVAGQPRQLRAAMCSRLRIA